MRKFRAFLSVLIVIGMLIDVSGLAMAFVPSPTRNGDKAVVYDNALETTCQDGVCEFRLENLTRKSNGSDEENNEFLLKARQENVRVLPNSRGIAINEAVSLNLPVGLIDLFDPELTLELTSDFAISRITGTAQVPFSLFGATDTDSKMNVSIGLESGQTLRSRYRKHSLEPLDANQKYIFFYVGPESSSITKQNVGVTSLSIPRGQSFLLIHHPLQTFVYADGKLSIEFPAPATPTSVLAVGTLLSAGTLLPFLLFKHSPTVHVSWLVTPNLKDAFLEVEGEYAISEGLLSKISSTDMGTIAVGGSLRVDNDGVLLRGVTETTLISGKLFDGGLALETFIPFQEDFWDTRVVLGGYAAIPILAFRTDGESRIDGTLLQYLVAGMLPEQATPKRQPIYLLAKDRTSDAIVLAGQRMQDISDKTSFSYQWTVQGIQNGANTATSLYGSAKDYAGTQFDWISSLVSEKAASSTEDAQLQLERSKNFTVASYDNATGIISTTFSNAAGAVQVGVNTGTHIITETANSAIESMTDGLEAAMQSVKEITEEAPENVQKQATCKLTFVRRNWCLRTGLCIVPPECQSNASDEQTDTKP